MNRDKLRKVRDHIAGLHPRQFDMKQWANLSKEKCGCIGYWSVVLFPVESHDDVGELACEFQIDRNTAHDLFFPRSGDGGYFPATIEQAVQVLDHLIATGKVDWSIVGGPK